MDIKINFKYKSNINQINVNLNRGVNSAILIACNYIRLEAFMRCPVGVYSNGWLGGNLRESLDTIVIGDIGYVFTTVHYAPFVEMGTYKMSAQPYLRPAAFNNLNTIKTILAKEINRNL